MTTVTRYVLFCGILYSLILLLMMNDIAYMYTYIILIPINIFLFIILKFIRSMTTSARCNVEEIYWTDNKLISTDRVYLNNVYY